MCIYTHTQSYMNIMNPSVIPVYQRISYPFIQPTARPQKILVPLYSGQKAQVERLRKVSCNIAQNKLMEHDHVVRGL